MKFEGSYMIAAPRDTVWAALLENGRLSAAMNHFQLLEVVGKAWYRGILNVGAGPLGGDFDGTIGISDLEPKQGFQIKFTGRGQQGTFRGNGRVHLHAQDQTTLFHCQGDIHFEGELADLAPRLRQANVNATIRRTVEGIERALGLVEDEIDTSLARSTSPEEVWPRTAVIVTLFVLAGLLIGLLNRKKTKKQLAD